MTPATAETPRLLNARETCAVLGVVSRSTLQRMIDAGTVPPPIVLGPRSYRWRADALEAVLRHTSTPATEPTR